jgi:hypothetical protein
MDFVVCDSYQHKVKPKIISHGPSALERWNQQFSLLRTDGNSTIVHSQKIPFAFMDSSLHNAEPGSVLWIHPPPPPPRARGGGWWLEPLRGEAYGSWITSIGWAPKADCGTLHFPLSFCFPFVSEQFCSSLFSHYNVLLHHRPKSNRTNWSWTGTFKTWEKNKTFFSISYVS